MKNRFSNESGFTLVEMMVSLLITGIMMVFVMRFVVDQMQGYQRQQLITDTQQNLRVAMDEISRDLRMAGAGIPNVPIYTGDTPGTPAGWLTTANTRLPDGVVYPIIIVRGGHNPNNNNIFYITPTHGTTDNNDSLIVIYQDNQIPLADTTLAQNMPTNSSSIVVNSDASFTTNTPFIITDQNGRKADLFMLTGTPTASGSTWVFPVATGGNYAHFNTVSNVNGTAGHYPNFNAASAADGIAGYSSGARVFAVRIVRYDWSDDMEADFTPITRLVNNDTNRSTDGSVGENFGDQFRSGAAPLLPQNVNAMRIEYAPPSSGGVVPTFYRAMPTNPYYIGTIRVTLTAHTAINPNAVIAASSTLFRTRTLTQDIQPRNYTSW